MEQEQGLHLPSPMLPATLGRVPLHDHNPLGLSPAVSPMEGIPSFSSYTVTHPPQPSLLNNKTPAPMLTYSKRKNTPSVPSLIILEPKPPQSSGKQKRGAKIVILSPKQQHQGNHDILAAKEGFDPYPLSHADKAISVTEAPVLTSNPSVKADALNFEGEGLPTRQVRGGASLGSASLLASFQKGEKRKPSSLLSSLFEIPSVAKKRRTDRARPNNNGKDKAGWIRKSAKEVLISACTMGQLHDRDSNRARQARPCATKLTVSLSDEDIRKDILLMTGQAPRKRPTKRPIKVQKEIQNIFPGNSLAGSVINERRYNKVI